MNSPMFVVLRPFRRFCRRWLAPLLPLLALTSCQSGKAPDQPGPVAFQAGEQRVTAGEINAFIRLNIPATDQAMLKNPEAKKTMLDSIEKMVVLGEKGRRAGLKDTPEFRMAEAQILARLYLQQQEGKVKISDAEAQQYYRTHQADFAEDRVRIRHILLRDPAKVPMVVQRLQADPSAFPALVAAASEDPESRTRGGEVGWLDRKSVPPEIVQAVFSLPVNGISRPIQTRVGLHIFQVMEKKQGIQPFEEAKDAVREQLKGQKQKEVVEKAIQEALKEIPIKEFPGVIDKEVGKGF